MLEILSRIDSGEKLTPQKLSDEFAVSPRTIFRDIRDLSLRFPMHYDNESKSYRFTEGFHLSRGPLSMDDIKIYLLATQLIKKTGLPSKDHFRKWIDSIGDRIISDKKSQAISLKPYIWIDIQPIVDDVEIRKHHSIIEKSIHGRLQITIQYQNPWSGESTKRTFNPYGLIFSEGMWHVIGYCNLRKDYRTLSLDGIRRIDITNNKFSIPEDFDLETHMRSGWRKFTGDGYRQTIKIKFYSEIAPLIKRRNWHPDQKIKEFPDGSILFTVTVAGTEEIIPWVLGFLPYSEIISPPGLKKTVKRILSDSIKIYEKFSK